MERIMSTLELSYHYRPYRKSALLPAGLLAAMIAGFDATTAAEMSAEVEGQTVGAAPRPQVLAAQETARSSTAAHIETAPTSAAGQLQISDRLLVSFFEHLDLGQTIGSQPAATNMSMRAFYQRLDLSGEYVVDTDGAIAIPLVGRFTAAGQSADQLRTLIHAAVEQATGRKGDVHVAILSREPVFVLGVVRNPGSYEFRPGMIAIKAVALAGGIERASEGTPQLLEALRERDRYTQANARHERLMARRERLVQQLKASGRGRAAAVRPPEESNGRLPPIEVSLLATEAAARAGEAGLQDAMITSARSDLAALKESVGLVEQQIGVREEKLRVLKQMQGRGVANLEHLWNAQKDVTDFQLQRKQLTMAVHLAQQKVIQAELTRDKISLDHQASAARELIAVEEEIAQLEMTLAASDRLARALEAAAMPRGVRPDDVIEFEILRRTQTGARTLHVVEGTHLMPGDVLKVLTRRPSALAAGGTAH
jgi:exopolysaccharide production protein ExoF